MTTSAEHSPRPGNTGTVLGWGSAYGTPWHCISLPMCPFAGSESSPSKSWVGSWSSARSITLHLTRKWDPPQQQKGLNPNAESSLPQLHNKMSYHIRKKSDVLRKTNAAACASVSTTRQRFQETQVSGDQNLKMRRFLGQMSQRPPWPPCVLPHTLVTSRSLKPCMQPKCPVVRPPGMQHQESACALSTQRIHLSFRTLNPLSVGCWLDIPKSKEIQIFLSHVQQLIEWRHGISRAEMLRFVLWLLMISRLYLTQDWFLSLHNW